MNDLKELASRIVKKAKENGLDDNLFFVMTYSDYNKKRKHIKEISTLIDKQGVIVDGKANPLLQDFDRATQSAAMLADKLMSMLGEKSVKKQSLANDDETKKTKKMPDFEMLPPDKLKSWCKKFDIDPSDYSKKFLYRALEKRWNFEYGD